MVKVTGDITVSFPASVLPLIYDVENAPMLSFLVRGTSSLEQILPNKALISRCAVHQLSIEAHSSFSSTLLFCIHTLENFMNASAMRFYHTSAI